MEKNTWNTAGRWRKRRGVVGTPTGEEHGEQGPANDGDAVQVWRERRLLQRLKFLHRLSDNNWFDLTISFANRLATCHNGRQVFNCQTMKTSSCRAHFTKHFTKQKQRAIQKRSKRFEWPLVVYYNQSVKSHSCCKVNSDISSEVALMLIKSEGNNRLGVVNTAAAHQQQHEQHTAPYFISSLPSNGAGVKSLHNASISLQSAPDKGSNWEKIFILKGNKWSHWFVQ